MSDDFRATRPTESEFAPFYARYIANVPEGDIVETLNRQRDTTAAFLRSIPDTLADYQYAPGKWTVRQVIGHMADCERVFAYRALRFSRGDRTPVPGFDENLFVDNAPFATASPNDLIDELEHLRRASVHMFGNLDAEAMSRTGTANDVRISVRAIAFVIAGHELHHLDIIRTRYLSQHT